MKKAVTGVPSALWPWDATRREARYDRRNAGRCSVVAKTNMVSKWVRNDPDLTRRRVGARPLYHNRGDSY